MGGDEETYQFLMGQQFEETKEKQPPKTEASTEPMVTSPSVPVQQPPSFQPVTSKPPQETLGLRQNPMVLLYRLQEACAEHANDKEGDKLMLLLADAKAFVENTLSPVRQKPSPAKQKVKKSFWTGKPIE